MCLSVCVNVLVRSDRWCCEGEYREWSQDGSAALAFVKVVCWKKTDSGKSCGFDNSKRPFLNESSQL